MKIRTIIVDDEKNSREVIRSLIKDHCPNVEVIGEASGVEEAYKLIKDVSPQLVLLDIQMPTGNGFTLLKKFEDPDFEVIFITSYDKFAINAIRYSALDYLLKPVDLTLLIQAFERAEKKLSKLDRGNLEVENLLENLSDTNSDKNLIVHEKEEVRVIKISKIIYLEGEINYTYVHTIEGEKLISPKSLKEYEDMLCSNESFVRAHRKYIINTHYIRSYSKGDPFLIKLSNGVELEASRRKKQDVLKSLRNRPI